MYFFCVLDGVNFDLDFLRLELLLLLPALLITVPYAATMALVHCISLVVLLQLFEARPKLAYDYNALCAIAVLFY